MVIEIQKSYIHTNLIKLTDWNCKNLGNITKSKGYNIQWPCNSYFADDKVTGRGCSTKKSSYKECETHSYGEVTEKFCYCKENNCNAASSPLPSLLTLALPLLLVILSPSLLPQSPLAADNRTNKPPDCAQCTALPRPTAKLHKLPTSKTIREQQDTRALVIKKTRLKRLGSGAEIYNQPSQWYIHSDATLTQ